MKLTSNDKMRRQYILIAGEELQELKKYTFLMCEAYGLDDRMENYKGKRPIGLYPWDLDCLVAVLEDVINCDSDYPDKTSKEFFAIKSIYEKLAVLHKKAYKE